MPFDIWCVHTNNNDMAYNEPTHFFTKEADAIKFAAGKGWYGGDAPITERKAIAVKDKVYLIDEIGAIDLDQKNKKKKYQLRKQAIAKLTKEELASLIEKDEEE